MRRRYSASNFIYSAADTAAGPETSTSAVSNTCASIRTGPNSAARANAIGGWRCWHGRSRWNAQVGHVIFRDLNRRRDHRRFRGKLRILIADHNLGRSDLHHGNLGQSSLRRRLRIMISSATSAADHRSRNSQDVCVGSRSDQSYDLALLGLLHNVMSKSRAHKNQTYQDNVDDDRAHQTICPVVVKFSPDFSRELRICSQS